MVCGKAPSLRSFYPFPALSAMAFLCLPHHLWKMEAVPMFVVALPAPPSDKVQLLLCQPCTADPNSTFTDTLHLKKSLFWGCFMNPHLLQLLMPHLAFPHCFSVLLKPPWCWAVYSPRLPKTRPAGLQANVHLLVKFTGSEPFP